VIPEIIDQFSSRKILTMKFEEGVRVDDLAALRSLKIDPVSVSKHLISLFSEMMFIKGFVHCDPHPGNIFVRPSNNASGCELVLLDHGSYQSLSEEVRYNYALIWKSVILADFFGLEKATERFGIDPKFAKFVGFLLTFSPPTKDPLVADSISSFMLIEDT